MNEGFPINTSHRFDEDDETFRCKVVYAYYDYETGEIVETDHNQKEISREKGSVRDYMEKYF